MIKIIALPLFAFLSLPAAAQTSARAGFSIRGARVWSAVTSSMIPMIDAVNSSSCRPEGAIKLAGDGYWDDNREDGYYRGFEASFSCTEPDPERPGMVVYSIYKLEGELALANDQIVPSWEARNFSFTRLRIGGQAIGGAPAR